MPSRGPLRPMPFELIERLFTGFKNDKRRWDDFARREFSSVRNGTEEPPGRAAIVDEFVDEKLGPDHDYQAGDLIIKIRRALHGFQQ
jgi:hypothetical protein